MKGSAVRIRASAFRICGRFACDTGRGGSARGYKALAQAHPRLRSTPRWSGSASTTSTSNQIHRRDSRTPIEETMEAPHDVVKAGKARYVGASSMYAWQFAKAQHVRRRRSSRCRTTTTDLPRGRAGDDPAVPRPGVGLLPWRPLARGLLAGNRTRDGEQHTVRARTDPFGESLYRPELDFAVIDRARTPRQNVSIDCGSPGRGFREAWPLVRAGCACLGPPQAGSDGADRRSDEARASRGRARRRRACTGREGDQAPRGAVPASLGARQRCSRSRQLR